MHCESYGTAVAVTRKKENEEEVEVVVRVAGGCMQDELSHANSLSKLKRN